MSEYVTMCFIDVNYNLTPDANTVNQEIYDQCYTGNTKYLVAYGEYATIGSTQLMTPTPAGRGHVEFYMK